MKTTTSNVLLAAGALAQLASAVPHHVHVARDYVTDVDYTTVYQTITVDGPAPPASTVEKAVSSGPAAKKANHWYHHQHSWGGYGKKSTSTDSAVSSDAVASSSEVSVVSATAASSSIPVLSASTYGAPSSSAEDSSTAEAYSASSYDATSTAQIYSTSSVTAEAYSAPAYVSSSTVEDSAVSSSTPESYSASPYSQSSIAKATSPSAYSSSTAAAATTSPLPIFSPSSYYGSATVTATSVQPTGSLGYNGVKAGLSGFPKIQDNCPNALAALMPTIGWYSDYWPNTTSYSNDGNTIVGIPMLWGDGVQCADSSASRVESFNDYLSSTDHIPIMFGFYEPDCHCATGSSEITDVSTGVDMWNKYLKNMAKTHGTVLGSPSMCKQKDEDWLKEATTQENPLTGFDIVSVHTNKNSLDGVKEDIAYYSSNYSKPIWVSEFACVNDAHNTWDVCTDQDEINGFINDVVPYFECTDIIVAYGPSNGMGLGDTWGLIDSDTDALTKTGQTYLNAVKNVQKNGCAHYGY